MSRKARKDTRDKFKYQTRRGNSHVGSSQIGQSPRVTRPYSDTGRPARTWACVGCYILCLDISDSPCRCPASRHKSSHTSLNDEGVCRESFCSSLLRIELISKYLHGNAMSRASGVDTRSNARRASPHYPISLSEKLWVYILNNGRPPIIVENRVLSRGNLPFIFLLIATWDPVEANDFVKRLQS